MKIINTDQEIMGGAPVFDGTRVPIKNLFDYLEDGGTIEGFLEDFPTVHRQQVMGLLELSQKMLSVSTLMFNESFA